MPRSSRHKSSKHSSRGLRDYSDSDEESGSRERRGGREEGVSRVSKDSGLSGKRRAEAKDGKDVYGSGNVDYSEEHGSLKRRKEKFSDGVSDRWNGGDKEDSNRAKSSGESNSRRRDDENEDARRSGKSEKHREADRKDGKESERKEREGRAEKLEERQEIATDLRVAATSEKIPERCTRKRRESLNDMGRHQYDVEDAKERHAFSGDDAARGGKQKDEKPRDEHHRDKYREEVNKDTKNRYDKQKDEYPAKDRSVSRSSKKYLRDEKRYAEIRPTKSKPHDNDPDNRSRYKDRDHDKDRDRGRDNDRDKDLYHDRDLGWDRDHDGDHDWDQDQEWIRDRERDHSSLLEKGRCHHWEHGKEGDHDREQERDYVRDRDYDDQTSSYKDHRIKKRSPEDRDDYHYSKSKEGKARSSDMEKSSLGSIRVEGDDRGRSLPRQGHHDNVLGSSRSRTSPASSSHCEIDEYRREIEDGPRYRDSSKDSWSKAISPRESTGFPRLADKGSKYTPLDKHNKLDDGYFEEFFAERSRESKASPRGLTERSPSSTSLERSRHTSRPGIRWNLDSEGTGKRSGGLTDGRDLLVTEGRLSGETSIGRHAVDESSQLDLSFNSKSGPSNSSFRILPQPPRRNNDPNLGRGHGNNWRGIPNWSSPVPNSFVPFQHGPPHGNFPPPIMPHFPTPLYGVRPPMEINQSGLPYNTADVDGFPRHLRPIGWQNMIDSSGLPQFHGWERSGLLREDPHLYRGPDWDQNRHLMNNQGWETNSDPWKGQDGDLIVGSPSALKKDEHRLQVSGDDSDPKGHGSTSGSNHQPKTQAKSSGERPELPPLEGEVIKSPLKTDTGRGPVSSKSVEVDASAQLSHAYLSKLNISAELADPQLYEQCLSVLGGEHCTADETPAMHIVLDLEVGHGNAMKENWDGFVRGSLFPAIDDSVLQKAMNIYKKQRLEQWGSIPSVNLGPLDVGLLTNGDRVDERDGVDERDRMLDEDEKGKVMEDIDENMSDIPLPTSDEMNVETPAAGSPAEQKLEDFPTIASNKESPHAADDTPRRIEIRETIDGNVQLVGGHEALKQAGAASGNIIAAGYADKDGSRDEGLEASMPNELNNDESRVANLSRIHQSPESTL